MAVILITAVLSVGAVGLASAANESEYVTAPEDEIEAGPIGGSEDVAAPSAGFIFARLSSTITRRPNSMSPVSVVMDQTDATSGVALDGENIKVENDGMYFIIFTPQVGMLNATRDVTKPACVDFWLTVNGADVPHSNIRWHSTKGDEGHRDVIVGLIVVMLRAGDVLNVRMAVFDPEADIGIEAVQPEGGSMVPSIRLSLFGFGQ